MAGREHEVARELRADALADEFDALAVGSGLAHGRMIAEKYEIPGTARKQHAKFKSQGGSAIISAKGFSKEEN